LDTIYLGEFMLIIALIINILIIVSEVYVLSKVKNRKDIFKYYTFINNLLCLITSIIFVIGLVLYVLNYNYLDIIRGLRYVVTCNMMSVMIMYFLFIGTDKNNRLSSNDFINNFNYKIGNLFVHYICPLLSLVSFIFFERDIYISNSIWTSIAAVPSILYWGVYGILSSFKLWDEPYKFSSNNKILDIIKIVLIPIIFIGISFILWNIK